MLGALLAPIGVRGLVALSPSSIPRAGEIGLDASTFAFTVLVSLVAAIASGLVPALATSQGDLAQQLNEGARGSPEGGRGKALRTILVVAEVALSLVLLAGAGVLLKSFSKVQTVNAGFDPWGSRCSAIASKSPVSSSCRCNSVLRRLTSPCPNASWSFGRRSNQHAPTKRPNRFDSLYHRWSRIFKGGGSPSAISHSHPDVFAGHANSLSRGQGIQRE